MPIQVKIAERGWGLHSKGEKRRHFRSIFATTIKYVVCSGPDEGRDELIGITVNMSISGLCFYTTAEIPFGTRIRILKGAPLNITCDASVRWTDRVSTNLYKTGCEFESS